MLALERLFRLEIEFHRQVRTFAPGTAETGSLHMSYAMQTGYELLLRAAGTVTASDIERLRGRLLLAGDPRDVLAASQSLKQIMGIRLLGA
jgi:hypothetical protein